MPVEFDNGTGNGSYKLPNAMTVNELISEGKSPEQAERIMNERVFGANFQRDAEGKPIEQGKGSASQPTPQHFEQLKLSEQRKRLMDPVANQDATARLIAEAVKQGIAAGMQANQASKEVNAEGL